MLVPLYNHPNCGAIMKSPLKILILFSVLLVAQGCGKPVVLTKMPIDSKHIFVKNYELKEKLSINVGDTVVRVKDYDVIIYHAKELTPDKDFNIGSWAGDTYLSGSAGTPITVVGSVKDKDKTYHLLPSVAYGLLIPINNNGLYEGGSASRSGSQIYLKGTGIIQIAPKDTIFTPSKTEKVDSSAGYINYEIVFTGISSDSINLLYREYTPDDMARPAFYQNLTYPIGTEIVQFKKIKIRIDHIDQGSMTYAVLEDGNQ